MGSPLLRRGRCLVGFPPSLPCALLLALVLTSSFLGAIASSRGMIRSAADVLTIPMVETPEEQGATVVIDLSGKKALEDDVSVAAIGVNANAMTDRRLTEWPVQGYAASLRELGANIVRYPGGETADSYLWSVPPFQKVDPRMARAGPEEIPCWDDPVEGHLSYEWFGCDPRQNDFPLRLHPDTLNFDDFMASATQSGAAVNLVVPLDGATEFNNDAGSGTRSVSAEVLLETATAWVAYCKDRYDVIFWEVGNQPHERLSSGDFAYWFSRYSVAMKAVDPGIKLGVSGDKPEWLSEVLSQVGDQVDWVSVAVWPLKDFASHSDYILYKTSAPASQPLEGLRKVLHEHSAGRAAPLWYALTSFSASDAPWEDGGPVRSALAFADELLRHAAAPGVQFLQFSTTKWFNEENPLGAALSATNELTLAGEVVALISRALNPSGQAELTPVSTSVPLLGSYFSVDRMNGDVSVVLVNHGGPTRVTLRLDDILKGDEDSPANSLWEASSSTLRPAKGSDETLQNWARPVTQGLHVDLSNGAVHVDVPETSIVSVRIVRRTRGGDAEQVGGLAPVDVPSRGRYLLLVDDLASLFTPYILRLHDLMRALTDAGHEVVHFLETSDDVKCPNLTRQRHLEEAGALWMCGRAPRLLQLLQQREHARESFDAVIMMPWYWFAPNLFERHADTVRQIAPQTALVILSDDAHGARAARLAADFQQYPHLPFSPDPDVETREARAYARADVVVTVSEEDAALVCRHMRPRAPCFAWTWSTNLTRARVPAAAEVPGFGARSGMALIGDFHNPTTATALQWFLWYVLPSLQAHFDARRERVPLTLVGSGFRSAIFIPLLAQLEKALRLSRAVGPLSLQVSPEGPEAVELLLSHRVMLAPVKASTGVNTKAFFGLSIGLPVVSTRAGLGGYFPRKATGEGAWEEARDREICGKIMAPEDVFFVGETEEEYTAALVEAYTNETAWTARLEASLEVATCLMNPDARAAIGNLLPAAVADARAHLESPKPSDMPARRAMLEMAPEVKPLVPKVCPSVSQACRQARRNGHGAPRGGFAGFASPGWYVWQVAAVAFLLRVPVTYALTPAKPAQRLGSPRKRIERSPSSLLLRTLGGLWSRFWYPKVPVRTFLFLGLLHVTVTLSFVAGTYLTSPAFVNPFLGVTSRADYFNPAFAAAKADSLARLVAPPVDVDCSCDGFDYFLVIGVSSAAHAAAERQSARDTWARFGALVPRCPVLVRFIVGRHKNATVMWRVAQEMEEYGDIVQDLSIEESYDALSKKTAAFHRWAVENVNFMFAFKTDDDIFVRVDRLVSALYQVREVPRLYWGNLGFMKMPVKDRQGEWGKWYSDFWPAGVPYPLFGRGHGFALKHDLVRALASWENKLDCLGLEDVCTGIHLASDHVYEALGRQGLNVVHLMETGLPVFEDVLTDHDLAQCEEGMTLALHLKRPVETMRTFVRTYETCGRMCGCGRGPEAFRNTTEVVSAFKLAQMRRSAAAAAWPYFDLENSETEMYHDKYACLFTQANYYSRAEQALCRSDVSRR